MKLGVSYNVFSGCELLPYMINQIRNHVDFILLQYQETNYYGDKKINQYDLDIIHDLHDKKIVDKINCFEIHNFAKTELEASIIEGQKRNQSKQICNDNGCDFWIDSDADETFMPREFVKAKQYIEDNNITYSICEYINYYKLPIFQGQRNPNAPRYSPFICKIDDTYNVTGGHEYCTKIVDGKTCSVDKSRGYQTDKVPYLFPHNEIMMQHFNFVRKRLREKWETHPQRLNSVTQNIDFLVKEIESLNTNKLTLHPRFCELLYLGDVRIKQVPNYFGIPLTF